MSDYLASLKGKATPFETNGITVMLRPLLFKERMEVVRWIDSEKDNPELSQLLGRRLTALALADGLGERVFTDESRVENEVAAELVDAIAVEVSFRSGLRKRDDSKKATPPSSSTSPETSSPPGSPLPGT